MKTIPIKFSPQPPEIATDQELLLDLVFCLNCGYTNAKIYRGEYDESN